MGKYEALPQFLRNSVGKIQRMSFGEIERVLGFKLPKSAYQYEAWWSNNPTGHSHSRAWIDAGWRTEAVDLAARKVTFQRIARSEETSNAKGNRWGCMAGTVTIMPGVDLTEPTESWGAEEGKLVSE